MDSIMPDMPRYPSSRRRNSHSQPPEYDMHQPEDQLYDEPSDERIAPPRPVDPLEAVPSRRRSQHDEDKARLRRARYRGDDDELQRRRARYREEDREYEAALRSRARSGDGSYRDYDSWRDGDEYDDDIRPSLQSSPRSSRRSEWWSRELPARLRYKALGSRYIEIVQSAFTRSAQATRRAENKLLARFARLQPWQRIAIIVVLIIAIVGPSLLAAVGGYQEYTQIKVRGDDGIQELLAIKDLLSTTAKGQGIEDKAKAVLQPEILAEIKQDSNAALADFEQIDTILSQPLSVIGIAGVVPVINTKIAAVEHLAKVGIDIASLGDDFASQGAALAPMFSTSLFATTGPPILTPATFQVLSQLLDEIAAAANDMVSQLATVQPSNLPVSATERAELAQVITQLPGAAQTVNALVQDLPMLQWALGVDSPRLFLVQTMDRAELRPGGGFTGQFAKLSLNGGRMSTINLTDVTVLDDNYVGARAPAQYQSWWPFGSWGLRESNMSGDYPTSAQLAMKAFTTESGIKVDGDISLSVLTIAHLLAPDIVGPITMPCYNVTVTDQNLENEIHYFQLGGGIGLDAKCTTASSSTTTQRKSFTAALALTLQERIRSLPADRLGNLVHSIVADFAAKNIEIYFGNASAEAQLAKQGLAAAMLRDNSIDSTYIVQANVSANKGSIFVTTDVDETISLDSTGDAHHNLTVTMSYRPTGDIYSLGLNTMRDYIRVYVPSQSRYIGGSGFDETTSPPLCYTVCIPKGAPVCQATPSNPTGAFLPGPYAPSYPRTEGSGNESGYGYSHTDTIGGPTNLRSDEPERAMFGGLVVIPPFCTATWTLQWSVPHVAGTGSRQNLPYTFIEQHQSGTENDVTVAIKSASGVRTPAINAHVAAQQSDLTWKLASN